jgi:hypothetical protein
MSLENTNIVIVVFAMPGCPACDDYLPRLHKQIAHYAKLGYPFIVHDGESDLAAGSIPILIYDATAKDESVQSFADRHKITGLPTTILLPRYGVTTKYEGTLTNEQIYGILNTALATNS